MKSSIDVEKVHCKDLHLGDGKGEPHFSIEWTGDDRVFVKILDEERIELDHEKMYNFLKEHFKK